METHDRPGFPWWAVVLLMFPLAAGVGVFTYNLGLEHGVAQSAPVVASPGPSPDAAPPVVFYRPYHFHWGFTPVPFLMLFWVFVFFLFLRRMWWGPRWYRRGYYYGYHDRIPPEFEEWHRRAHGQQAPPTTTQL